MWVLDISLSHKLLEDELIGGGVLPYCVDRGQVLVLLGKETSDNKFGLFGGRLKTGLTIEESVAAEFHEETLGQIRPREQILQQLYNKEYSMMFKTAAGPHKFFITYMIEFPFDINAPKRFSVTRQNILGDSTLGKEIPGAVGPDGRVRLDYLEKSELAWFALNDILDAAANAKWNHPVEALHGRPCFRRPFLAGLHAVLQYVDIRRLFSDIAWCAGQSRTDRIGRS